MKWTLEEDKILREMVHDGSTAKEIGDVLGRGKSSVKARRRYLYLPQGITGSVPHIDENLRLLELIRMGYSLHTCSKILGKSASAVKNMANRMVRDGLLKVTNGNRATRIFYPSEGSYEAPKRRDRSGIRNRRKAGREITEHTRDGDTQRSNS